MLPRGYLLEHNFQYEILPNNDILSFDLILLYLGIL